MFIPLNLNSSVYNLIKKQISLLCSLVTLYNHKLDLIQRKTESNLQLTIINCVKSLSFKVQLKKVLSLKAQLVDKMLNLILSTLQNVTAALNKWTTQNNKKLHEIKYFLQKYSLTWNTELNFKLRQLYSLAAFNKRKESAWNKPLFC